MVALTIDGHLLRKMIVAGANKLAEQKDYVDALNVFPVPDGDTGTNMSLTALAAAREVEKLNTANVYEVAKAASGGALRGARGNSGVILSQLFRGFAKGLEDCTEAGVDELARAMNKAVETAYKAVMKPKEGTILTVARELGEKALEVSFETEDLASAMVTIVRYGYDVLAKTPDMLPVLKQAGVVDAGGQGLLTILDGCLEAADSDYVPPVQAEAPTQLDVDFSALNNFSHADITFGYCTEFFVIMDATNDEAEDELKAYLSNIGDSIVVVTDETFIKIHVHTDNPGLALEKALTFGALDGLKIENMRLQHAEAVGQSKAQALPTPIAAADSNSNFTPIEKTTGFVVVSIGEGFKTVFEGLGADVVIEGGQTMNPSTEDILAAIDKVNAENVIVLPNNKNIVLAAQQATYLNEQKKILVVPTKSVPQGISAMLAFSPMDNAESNAANMEEAAQLVHTGQITYAVRDTVIDDKEIKEGDFLCMIDGNIELVRQDLQAGAKELLSQMLANGGEVATIFYGADATEEDAQALADSLAGDFPDAEIDVQCGAQPLYFYIFSVE